MKTYIFESMRGTVAKIEANNMNEAIALFNKKYVGFTYSFVAEE